jgi:hypothetical protein
MLGAFLRPRLSVHRSAHRQLWTELKSVWRRPQALPVYSDPRIHEHLNKAKEAFENFDTVAGAKHVGALDVYCRDRRELERVVAPLYTIVRWQETGWPRISVGISVAASATASVTAILMVPFMDELVGCVVWIASASASVVCACMAVFRDGSKHDGRVAAYHRKLLDRVVARK